MQQEPVDPGNAPAPEERRTTMVFDRYLKAALTVIAAALVVIALNPWLRSWHEPLGLRAAEAQGQAQYEISLPKTWGKLVGFSNGNVLLEAQDGTLREVDMRGKAPEYPKVKVLARWN
jgi:hypothetical protein